MSSKTKERRPLTEVQGVWSTNKNEMVGRQQAVKKVGVNNPPVSESSKNGTPTALSKVKSGLVTKKKIAKTVSTKEVQTENGDHSVVTAEEAPLEYWKELAIARQEALEKTLHENYELHQRIKELEEEKVLLEKLVEQAKQFSELLENLSDEDDPDESGIGLGRSNEGDDSVLEKD